MSVFLVPLAISLALAGDRQPVVYEGRPTGAFPQAVAVGVSDGGALVTLCSGVVVAEDAVLTAAHCLADIEIFVDAGLDPEVSIPGAGDDGNDLRVAIVEQEPHPDWDPRGSDRGVLRDAAVLHLAEAVPVVPAVLAERPSTGWLGRRLRLVGFGAEGDDAASSGVRTVVTLPVVGEGPAVLWLYERGGGNLCTGDSGGPAWLEVGGQARLVGINVFTYQPDGGSGCEGGGSGTLLAEEVWSWVAAELEGREWGAGSGGCATAPLRAGWPGLLGMVVLLTRGSRRRKASRRPRRPS